MTPSPAVTGSADDEIGIGERAVEEHLAEMFAAGDVAQRPDVDAGLVERHEERRDALVLGHFRVGARENEDPLR